MKAEATIDSLPDDLMLKILLLLPVRCVFCLKCVSKSWYTIISSPIFAKLHKLQLSSHPQCPDRILQVNNDSCRMRCIDIKASLRYDSFTLKPFCDAHIPPYTDTRMIDSCRGIVLFQNDSHIWMWNPTTRAYKCISHVPPQAKICLPFSFCYDESLDDYFIGSTYLPHPQYFNGYFAYAVLSLRNNSWDKLELNHHYRTHYRNRGPIFKGAMHFMVLEDHRDGSVFSIIQPTVIAYDVKTKDLQKVPTPSILSNSNLNGAELGVLEGCLALTCVTGTGVELWLMREYAFGASWTKLISVPNLHQNYISYNQSFLFVKEGDEYITSHVSPDGCEGLSRWNEKGELLEHRTYGQEYHKRFQPYTGCWLRAIEYTETLLPLP